MDSISILPATKPLLFHYHNAVPSDIPKIEEGTRGGGGGQGGDEREPEEK